MPHRRPPFGVERWPAIVQARYDERVGLERGLLLAAILVASCQASTPPPTSSPARTPNADASVPGASRSGATASPLASATANDDAGAPSQNALPGARPTPPAPPPGIRAPRGGPPPATENPRKSDPAKRYQLCASSADCMVQPAGCCYSCGNTPGFDGLRAASRKRLPELRRDDCSVPASEATQPLACPACVARTNPHIVATCERGACRLVDVRTRDLDACKTDEDCAARPSSCRPEEDSPRVWTPISRQKVRDFTELVCGKTPCTGCDEIPETHRAIVKPPKCVDGRCTWRRLS